MNTHFLRDDDISAVQRESILRSALDMKRDRYGYSPLAGPKCVALIFDKPSTRTRVSFTVGIAELGGVPVLLDSTATQMGRGEPIEDAARVLDRQVSAIVWRTFEQENLERMAGASRVPVVNALSNEFHPCQALADLMTVRERFGDTKGVTLAFFGDIANNTANSFMIAGAASGMHVRIVGPSSVSPDAGVFEQAQELAAGPGGSVELFRDAKLAAYGAEVIATDTWVSMGAPEPKEEDLAAFRPFVVDESLVNVVSPDAIVLHCLPACRGREISVEVLDGPQSAVWDQAENRLHVQKALLAHLLAAA